MRKFVALAIFALLSSSALTTRARPEESFESVTYTDESAAYLVASTLDVALRYSLPLAYRIYSSSYDLDSLWIKMSGEYLYQNMILKTDVVGATYVCLCVKRNIISNVSIIMRLEGDDDNTIVDGYCEVDQNRPLSHK